MSKSLPRQGFWSQHFIQKRVNYDKLIIATKQRKLYEHLGNITLNNFTVGEYDLKISILENN